jgi:hypothetical protein
MKKNYRISLMIALFAMISFSVSAQRIVEIDGYIPGVSSGTPEDYNDIITDAIVGDSTARAANPNTIYVLKRNHIYPMGGTINNYGYHLHIRGEEGDGFLPEIMSGKNATGVYNSMFIVSRDDITLENIQVNGFKPDGSFANRSVRHQGVGSTVKLKNVVWYADRGAGIAFLADSIKAYIEDCVVQNTGHHNVVGGNGRFIDLRTTFIDTLIIKNSTLTNASDRVIRNMGTKVNYFEMDHFTAVNNTGLHGSIQLGYVKTAKVTNSIFANTISLGHEDDRVQEQTQPVKHFAVISVDTVFDGQVLEVRNNNIYTDQAIIDVWAKYDSVSAPYVLAPTLETALGNAASEAYIEEPLVFTASCGPVNAFVDTYYATPNATEFPENWCIGGEGETGLFPDQVDLSYSTDAVSFSAGDDNYPLGNLNYFPDMKAKWEAGAVIGVEEKQIAVGNVSLRNYPNPFSNSTTIAYDLKTSATVSLELYNAAGSKIRRLVNEYQQAGTQQVTVDASDLPGGLYFIKLDTGTSVYVGKMLHTK